MIIMKINDLKYYVKDRLLIEVDNLSIQNNDRIGLVGRNGSGKTTLLELLAGTREADVGSIVTETSGELLPQLKNTNTTKSGGEVTKEYINKSLAKKNGLLLADEPTTNLDTEHMEKLEKQLSRWQGAIVIVSHDRSFLDALCTTIWAIENDGKVKEYKGNYKDYTAQKELEVIQRQNAYEKYQQKKGQLENALELKEQKAQRATKKPKKISSSEARITGAKPYFAKKQKKLQKTAKAIETRLENLEKVEKIKEIPAIKMDLPNIETFTGQIILRIEELKASVKDRILWNPSSFQVRGGDKIAIIGRNGVGKTTLLKKIVASEPGVTSSTAMKIGYFSQNLDVLDTEQSILENVVLTSKQDETLIRTVLARLHFYRDDVYKKVDVLSGGERVKVAFAKLFVSDINTLILDEPTNFLDIDAVEALEGLLQNYEGTVLLVSHDRQFIQNTADRILIIENEEIKIYEGNYDNYKNHIPKDEADSKEQELLLIETKITEILGRLSLEPSEALDQEFQALLKRKREMGRS
ncbi:Vga family ABC-F type ribosomal protection protein [Oceanobacillus rekensis]|uniref:Vga family ABC-F type ribosomal protection protein n=1 Tax=Oceanobacillus rekensis TaxID=937927 RepID=UPI000B4352EC|nr:Vga family ABC-F type ribosomal protection protein [Oceanobacillus rekensis]